MVYGKRRENEKAIAEFELAIDITPYNARSYMNLGLIYYQMGDKEKARKMWEKALFIDPQFSDAERALQLLNKN